MVTLSLNLFLSHAHRPCPRSSSADARTHSSRRNMRGPTDDMRQVVCRQCGKTLLNTWPRQVEPSLLQRAVDTCLGVVLDGASCCSSAPGATAHADCGGIHHDGECRGHSAEASGEALDKACRHGHVPGSRTVKMLFTAAAALDCSVDHAFTAAVRHRHPDLAEVCCTPESALSSMLTELGRHSSTFQSLDRP